MGMVFAEGDATGAPIITEVRSGSEAEDLGVQRDWKISGINGEDVKGQRFADVVGKLKLRKLPPEEVGEFRGILKDLADVDETAFAQKLL